MKKGEKMKKQWLVSMTLLLLFLGGATKCLADESQAEYKSNGVTGFYGTYEPITDSTAESSTAPSYEPNNEQAGKTSNGEIAESKSLPKTGERTNNKWLYLGILVLLLLFLLLIYKKRKGEKK